MELWYIERKMVVVNFHRHCILLILIFVKKKKGVLKKT